MNASRSASLMMATTTADSALGGAPYRCNALSFGRQRRHRLEVHDARLASLTHDVDLGISAHRRRDAISNEEIHRARQTKGVRRSVSLPAEVMVDALARANVVDVGALFTQHAPFLLRVVERLTGPGIHIEDLVQEVFIVAHRRRAELREGPELRGWLYRVAANRAQQHRRSLWRRFRLESAVELEPRSVTPTADDVVAQHQRGARVRAAVLALPFLHREAFVLVELEGLDTRSAAICLDVPEGTVWSRLSTARRLIRERWTGETP